MKFMKKLIILFLLILFLGCASNIEKNVLREGDSTGKIVYKDTFYYIVEVSDLKRTRKADTLTYIGTADDYHLFRVWSKVCYGKDEIHHFAVNKKDCLVKNPRPPEDERAKNPVSFRRVELCDGKCIVKD